MRNHTSRQTANQCKQDAKRPSQPISSFDRHAAIINKHFTGTFDEFGSKSIDS
jgi:hypothetical protein